MDQELIEKFYNLLYASKLSEFKSLVKANPILVEEIDVQLAFQFTEEDGFEVLKYFIKGFIDINSIEYDNNFLMACCSNGMSIEGLKWLIDSGIDKNFKSSKTNANVIVDAVIERGLEVVKFFVEEEVEFNYTFFRFEGKQGKITHVQTFVDLARMFGKDDIAEYFLSLGVKPATKEQIEKHMPPKKSLLKKLFGKKANERKEFVEYLENEVGEISKLSLQAIVGDLEIISIDPSEDKPWRTLLTYGVSKTEMKTNEDELKYCEFAIQLPSDWPLDKESLKSRKTSGQLFGFVNYQIIHLRPIHY